MAFVVLTFLALSTLLCFFVFNALACSEPHALHASDCSEPTALIDTLELVFACIVQQGPGPLWSA